MRIAFYLAHHGSLLDRLIDWFSGRDGFSHVELIFRDGMFFSTSGMDRCVRFKKIDPTPEHWRIFDLPIDPRAELRIREWCRRRVGEPYDYCGVLHFVIPVQHRRGRWFCSEIVTAALESAGLIGPVPCWRVSPNELYLMLGAARIIPATLEHLINRIETDPSVHQRRALK